MKNKVFKNVILALCVLAVVLQPVITFASSTYTYNNISAFLDNWRYSIGDNADHYVSLFSIDNPDYNAYEYALFWTYMLLENKNYIYCARITEASDTESNLSIRVINPSDWTLARVTNSNTIYFYANKDTSAFVQNIIIDNVNFREDIEDNLDPPLRNYSAGNFFYLNASGNSSYISFDYLTTANGFTTSSYPNRNVTSSLTSPVYIFTYTNSAPYNPDLPSGNVLPPTEPDVNNEMFYWWLNSNFYYRDGQSALNQDYVPVGRYLTYQMLAMNNPDQNYITVDGIDYHNWYYDLAQMMTAIVIRLPSAENIQTIASGISDINDRLETAFPDDQADMNDSIAEQILDDSNGNGLTIDKISSAKSDLDDGLDTFKLDVSGAQYSNPFSALDDADWSFWSQTTLNNLGSGYSFEYSDATLMDGEDVFDVNQRTLLDLLGW